MPSSCPWACSHRSIPRLLKALFSTTNVHGALVTMPHKVTTTQLVDEMTTTAKIAGACNAILRRPDGTLLGDMFDGAGFVRGVERKGKRIAGARALVIGCGGVGSAIAASLAAAGSSAIGLYDPATASAEALADRLRQHYPALQVVNWLEGSRGLRHRGQRHAARHEARRSDAGRHRPRSPDHFRG